MADPVELAFRRAAAPLFPEGATVLVGVSGGGDSVALLHLLGRTLRGRHLRLVVAHLDHALRRGSAGDRTFVERVAADLALPFVSARRSARPRRGESPEEAARRVRRAFLIGEAQRAGAARIALGHTLDDQAETVLLRLARGGGASAITAMAPLGPGPFARPLLGTGRAELRDWLTRNRIRWREDPTNRSLRHERNRVRLRVLPALIEVNPAAARHLAEFARLLREDAAWLDAEAARALDGATISSGGAILALDPAALASAPPALAGRMALRALERAGADPRRCGARHAAALIALASASPGRSLDLPGRTVASRRRGRLELRRGGR